MSLCFRVLFLYFLLILSLPLVQAGPGQSRAFFLKFADVFSCYFRLWYAVNCRIDEISCRVEPVELIQSDCKVNHNSIHLNVLNKEKKFNGLLKKYDVAPADYPPIYDHMKIIEKSEMMMLIRLGGENVGVIDNISKVVTKVSLEILRKVLPDYKIDDVSDINTNTLNAKQRIEIYLYYIDCGDDIQKEIDFWKTKEGEKFEKVFLDFLRDMQQSFARLTTE